MRVADPASCRIREELPGDAGLTTARPRPARAAGRPIGPIDTPPSRTTYGRLLSVGAVGTSEMAGRDPSKSWTALPDRESVSNLAAAAAAAAGGDLSGNASRKIEI